MDFLEVEGKELLARFGIKINESIILKNDDIPANITFPCVLKGQILSGKRGKAGAVKVVKTKEELITVKKEIEKITINGKVMEGVVACEFLPIKEEFYLGMTLDTKNRQMLMLFTTFGGMDIEELAEKSPEKLLKFNCTEGFDKNLFKKNLSIFNLSDEYLYKIIEIAEKLHYACFELDATTIEINPLALLNDGELVALDCKLVIDDNSMYRQGNYILFPRTIIKKSIEEKEAEQYDLTYIELDKKGNIGMMAGGAGIGMATMDTIHYYGGLANNFLDLGGGVTEEKTYHAMKTLINNQSTDYIFINVFGGINNCADMARGITKAYKESGSIKPVVVKSRGFNQEQGWELYEQCGFLQTKYGTTDEAVQLLLNKEV